MTPDQNTLLSDEFKSKRIPPRLTIVMPLKGRDLFTLRFLWHVNRENLPYRFILADGQVNPALAALLEKSGALFPNLDLEYIRYPDDVDFRHFFAKMADALSRVQSPYVMLADNDDFVAYRGLEMSMDFLASHSDYVCCGGGIAGLSVYGRSPASFGMVVGPVNKLAYRYMPYDRSIDIDSSSVMERLVVGLRNSWSYYAVFRTSALQTIAAEAHEMDLSDLQLYEKFCAMRTLTLGKARSDAATVAYLRQYWTTLASAFSKDWVHHLLRSRFSIDFSKIVAKVSEAAARADGCDREEVAERVRESIAPWLRDFLRVNYGLSADVRRQLRGRTPAFLRWLKTRRRYSVPREREALIGMMRRHGASEEYLNTFRAELERIEDVVQGKAFRAFLHKHAASLLPESATRPAGSAALTRGSASVQQRQNS
jgi:glycosyltransferase domain-containing protein